MVSRFISLEWRSFFRSASFKTNIALKILMLFGALYFMILFLSLGVGAYYLMEKSGLEPMQTVNQYMIYYLVSDWMVRFFFQNTPVMNIRPLLVLPIHKNTIVHYSLGKSLLSFFNWIHTFFLIPFTIVLMVETGNFASPLFWFLSVFLLLLCNNFIAILLDKKDNVFYMVAGTVILLGVLQYYGFFDITEITAPVFGLFYDYPLMVLVSALSLVLLYRFTFSFFKKNLYLDAGLSIKQKEAQMQELTWLNRLGTLGTFIKNDIRLILRNKRSKTTVLTSIFFLFYGFFFIYSPSFSHSSMNIFAGIFVSGGFLFTFGQFVPSWDSSYYPLMMSQNIQYRDYLNAKWWLIVIATSLSAVLASFYIYISWSFYLGILVGAVYNIGVNAHIVLWGGAYVKTPIDLTSNRNAFGDKKAFNVKTLLLTIPKLVLPMILYALGYALHSPETGLMVVAAAGIAGFAFKGKVFGIIEKVYKTEKHKTLAAYKQKN